MEASELELLKKVLPEGCTLTKKDNTAYPYVIEDEEGEVLLRPISNTARGVVHELVHKSHRDGLKAGRENALREMRDFFGITNLFNALRNEMHEALDAIKNPNR